MYENFKVCAQTFSYNMLLMLNVIDTQNMLFQLLQDIGAKQRMFTESADSLRFRKMRLDSRSKTTPN